MRLKHCFFIIAGTMHLMTLNAQKFTLPELINRAQEQSLSKKIAVNNAMSGYWAYNSYKARLYPKVFLNGTLPAYTRNIDRITIPTGEDIFVPRNQSYEQLALSVSQNVGLTGGVFSLYSSLSRIDVFSPDKTKQYSVVPVSLSYYQNTLFYNSFKWEKKIEPVRLEENKRSYSENIENIALNSVSYYFQYLAAENQLFVDKQNLDNADTLLKITQTKFEIGTRDKNDLLQAKLNLSDAKNNVIRDNIELEKTRQSFVQFFRLRAMDSIKLVIPDELDFFYIDEQKALAEARKMRQAVLAFRRRRLEAEQQVQYAKANAAPSIGVSANFGLSQASEQLGKSYQNLQRQQTLTLTLAIPILDWGENKSQIARAKANLDLVNVSIEQENEAFEQEIRFQVMQWNSLKTQLATARETRDIAIERYDVAKQRYMLGSINFTEFNNAQAQKDNAINTYIYNTRVYWESFFLIRKLTMFDFKANKPIEYQLEMLH